MIFTSRVSRAVRRFPLLVLWAGLSSCATPKHLTWEWAEPETSWNDEKDTGDAVGVILLREERFVFQKLGLYGDGRSEVHFHIVQKLLTEAGIDAMATTVPWPKKGKLLHLDARTIAPDGTITFVTEEQLFAEEAHLGKDERGNAVGQNLRRFTFPRVEVGSVLELSWAFEMPGLYSGWTEVDVLGELPIRKYVIEFVVEKVAQPDFMVVNHTVAPRLVDKGDGMQHLVLEWTDLPARKYEAYSPSSRTAEPWWMYRTIAYRYPNRLITLAASWEDAVRGRLRDLLHKGEGKEGVVLREAGACNGAQACLVDAALAQVRDSVAWTGHDDVFDFRSPGAIKASGEASSSEKAALLWTLLDSVGISARLAGLARAHTNEVDKSFPHTAWLNHTVVKATVDGADVWLDPSCEYCTRGELPAWSLGREALVATWSGDDLKVAWETTAGRLPATADRAGSVTELRVAEDGSVEVVRSVDSSAERALQVCRTTRSWNDDDWRESAEDLVRGWSRTGRVRASTNGQCQKAAGTYTRSVEAQLHSFVGRVGDKLVVPLSLFDTPISVARHKERTQSFVVPWPAVYDDELRIVPPQGWTIAKTPAGFERQFGGVTLRVDVTPQGSGLSIKRQLRLEAGVTPAAEVEKLKPLLFAASDLGDRTVVLVKAPAVSAGKSPPH